MQMTPRDFTQTLWLQWSPMTILYFNLGYSKGIRGVREGRMVPEIVLNNRQTLPVVRHLLQGVTAKHTTTCCTSEYTDLSWTKCTQSLTECLQAEGCEFWTEGVKWCRPHIIQSKQQFSLLGSLKTQHAILVLSSVSVKQSIWKMTVCEKVIKMIITNLKLQVSDHLLTTCVSVTDPGLQLFIRAVSLQAICKWTTSHV